MCLSTLFEFFFVWFWPTLCCSCPPLAGFTPLVAVSRTQWRFLCPRWQTPVCILPRVLRHRCRILGCTCPPMAPPRGIVVPLNS